MPYAHDIKIMIVDDQQCMRGVTRHTLRKLGFTDIHEARSGREAVSKLSSANFDMIISDWNMADIDGLSLLRAVRKHPRTRTMPFIMATGRSDQGQIREAIAAGVNNYIIKPFDIVTMRRRIEAVVGALT